MRIQEQILKQLRSFPNNVLLVSIVFLGVAFTLTSRTPTEPPISDFAYYVDMANGLSAPDPFGKRILVPFLAGLLGGSPLAFHYMNIILVAGAAVLLYLKSDSREQGLVSSLLFLGCTRAITIYAGEPSPDGMTYFLIALTLYLLNTDKDWCIIIVACFAAATHPIAIIMVGLIWFANNTSKPVQLLYLVPGVLVFICLFPQSYGMLFIPDIPRALAMVKSVNVLWIGILSVRKDSKGLTLIGAICVCTGFSLVASNVDRVFSSLGLLLAPMLGKLVLPKKSEPT